MDIRAFVTGGSGFVGSALIRRLLAENHEVVEPVLVEGLMLVARRGRPGEVYFVTDGQALPFRTFTRAYLSTAGVLPPEGSVPGRVLRATGAILESMWTLLRLTSQPPVNRVEAAVVSEPQIFNGDKTRRELGYETVTTFDEAIAQLVEV